MSESVERMDLQLDLLDQALIGAPGDRLADTSRMKHARLPRSLSVGAWHDASARYWERIGEHFPNVQFVGVGESGIVLASALALSPCAGSVASLTTISKAYSYVAPDLNPADGPVVLVDNAMHTGNTARTAITELQRQMIPVAAFVKLFNYKDELELEAEFKILADFDVRVHSLYSVDELEARARGIQRSRHAA